MTMPTLVVVSGPAGTGKTTLAHALAKAVGCPAICRDEIKEGMVHALGVDFEATAGDPLTLRTLGVFFRTLRVLLEAEVTVVAEAAFQDRVWRPNLDALRDLCHLRVVRCRADPSVARQRVADRPRRAAHTDASVLASAEYYDVYEPISLPAPTIDVDTGDGYDPPLNQVVAFVAAG
jgi:predicted kinase